MSLNKVLLLGRLGAAPELKYTQSQTPICTLRLATNERRKGADGEWTEHTEWHTVVTFGKTAENCNQYLEKGRQCFVEGRIQTRKYQDKDGKERYWTEIIANTVQFVGGRDSAGSGASGFNVEQSSRPAANSGNAGGSFPESPSVSFEDDDIPF